MDATYLVILFIDLLLIAFFSGIEIAFVSLNRVSIEFKKKQGSQSANIIAHYFSKPEEFITSSLIGLNIVLVFFSITFQSFLAPLWNNDIINHDKNPMFIFLIELFTSTSIIFLFGEFLPKTIFKTKNNFILILLAPLIYFSFLILKPITHFFVFIAVQTIRIVFKMKEDEKSERSFQYVDLEYFIAEKTLYEKNQDNIQNKLLRNALQFPKTAVRDCVIPQTEIVAININDTVEQAIKKCIQTDLSRIIVYKNNLNKIVGYIHHLDLLRKPRSIKSILIPIPVFAETTKINQVLTQLSQQGKSIGWVIDEYGATAGMITMEKLLEEVFGKNTSNDEHVVQQALTEKKISEHEYVLSGRLEIDYLNETYHLLLPKNDIETLSGFLIFHYGEIPKKEDVVMYKNYKFTIEKVNQKTIEQVRLEIVKA